MGELTEHERVMLAANALSAYRFVVASPARAEKWMRDQTGVSSGQVADLTGLSVEVVEAAVRNLGERIEV